MKTLVLGASGLLGSRLVPHLRNAGHMVIPVSRSGGGLGIAADLLQPQAVESLLERFAPDRVVNLSALADVDACQRDPDLAYAMNAWLPSQAAEACSRVGLRFVHISTDMVYDGPGPHPETDESPCNVYAKSKLEGDRRTLDKDGTTLRVNFVGRSLSATRKSFSDWLIESFRSGRELALLDEVRFSPLSMKTLCDMIVHVLSNAPAHGGIFNLGSHGGLSKREFALRLAHRCGFESIKEHPVGQAALGLQAPRPNDMRMDVSHFESSFLVSLPDLDSEIGIIAKEYT